MKNGDKFTNAKGKMFEIAGLESIPELVNGVLSYVQRFQLICLEGDGWDKRFEFGSADEDFDTTLLALYGFEAVQPLKAIPAQNVLVTPENIRHCAARIAGKGGNYSCRIVEKGDNLYQVHSQSGEIYAVFYHLFTDEARCSCPDFQHTRRDKSEICKHILSVVNFTEAQLKTNQRIAANRRFAANAVRDLGKVA